MKREHHIVKGRSGDRRTARMTWRKDNGITTHKQSNQSEHTQVFRRFTEAKGVSSLNKGHVCAMHARTTTSWKGTIYGSKTSWEGSRAFNARAQM